MAALHSSLFLIPQKHFRLELLTYGLLQLVAGPSEVSIEDHWGIIFVQCCVTEGKP